MDRVRGWELSCAIVLALACALLILNTVDAVATEHLIRWYYLDPSIPDLIDEGNPIMSWAHEHGMLVIAKVVTVAALVGFLMVVARRWPHARRTVTIGLGVASAYYACVCAYHVALIWR